ncbi:hypothetical protein D3C76_1752740 [compost metagenome]
MLYYIIAKGNYLQNSNLKTEDIDSNLNIKLLSKSSTSGNTPFAVVMDEQKDIESFEHLVAQ